MYIAPSCSHRSSTGDPYRRSHPAANPAAACLVPWPPVACLAVAYQVATTFIAVAVAVLSSAARQASLRFR